MKPVKTLIHVLIPCLGLAVLVPQAQAAQPPREDIEWLDVWLPDSNAHSLPRVLLVGDSITRAYYPQVEKALKGKAYVARLATSKCLADPAFLAELSLVLSEAHFAVIHFNNGMHGWDFTEADYQKALPKVFATIHKDAPEAKLLLATTTPVRQGAGMEELAPRTPRVRERNRILLEFASQKHLPVDDLFGLVENHPEYYAGGDGVHLAAKGVAAQADQAANEIEKLLK